MEGFYLSVGLLISLCIGCLATDTYCPPDHVQHINNGRAVWCQPVFNCGPNATIATCTKDGESDTCRSCQEGQQQPDMTSSLEAGLHPCFTLTSDHSVCPEDTTISATMSSTSSCPMFCRCKYEECYFGSDPCLCTHQLEPCGSGHTLNHDNGECEECPPLTYKHDSGCGPCRVNETAWRLDRMSTHNCSSPAVTEVTLKSTTPVPSVTSSPSTGKSTGTSPATYTPEQKPTDSDEKQKTSDPGGTPVFIVVILIVVIAVLCVVIVVGILLYIRRNSDQSFTFLWQRKSPEHTPSREDLGEGALLTAGPQNGGDMIRYQTGDASCEFSKNSLQSADTHQV